MAYTDTTNNRKITVVDGHSLAYKITVIKKPKAGSNFVPVVIQTIARSLETGKEKELQIRSPWLIPSHEKVELGKTYDQIPEPWHPNCNYQVVEHKPTGTAIGEENILVKVRPVFQPSIAFRRIEISKSNLATHTKNGLISAEIVARHAVTRKH
ncbi:MAG: hypothetical protein WC408_01205 [Candidatus Micrarchaeia archaeon]|jgi:hypothetical protein